MLRAQSPRKPCAKRHDSRLRVLRGFTLLRALRVILTFVARNRPRAPPTGKQDPRSNFPEQARSTSRTNPTHQATPTRPQLHPPPLSKSAPLTRHPHGDARCRSHHGCPGRPPPRRRDQPAGLQVELIWAAKPQRPVTQAAGASLFDRGPRVSPRETCPSVARHPGLSS